MTLQDRLKNLIRSRKTTITALARNLGITRQAVAQYLDGTGKPNSDKLAKISKYFGVSSDYLLGLSNVPTTDTNLQAICNRTGLSDDFVSWLESHKDYAPQIEKLSRLMIDNGFIGGDS